jgi:trigger factor
MKATWEKIDKNIVSIDVEVGAEKVADALDQAFKKVVQKVNVPGFRKGKVPRGIFESRFGIESLYQDAIDILLPDAYTEAVSENKLEPVDRPEIDVEQFAKGQTFKFKAKVIVKPEVTVIEEGAAENGDITVIDFDGYVDGEPFEGGQSERYSLELGSNSFIPGFEEQVVGMQIGDYKDVEVTFPDSYHAENLAGKAAVFKVKLHEIKRKSLPALDDEFAKDVSEFDTIEEYKQDLSAKLKESKDKEGEQAREVALVDKATAAATVEVPEPMIVTETDYMIKDFENRLKMQGMNMDLYFQFSGQNETALRDQMRTDAEKRVRNNLVLDAIAKAEGIEASDEDVTEELEKLSKSYNRPAEELREIFEKNGNISNLQEDVALRKTIKFLLDNSKTV